MTNQVANTNTANTMLLSTYSTQPVIASGFGTSPTLKGVTPNCFAVTVGSGGAASGTLTLPATPNGWMVLANDVTAGSSLFLQQTASSTTSVTVTGYGITTGLAANMSAGDVIVMTCIPY
jgi:hypothetical protein